MRVVRYTSFGVPEKVLEVIEVPRPEPGPGEVRITVEAAPIHLADLKHIRGVPWFDQYKPPHTPGYEGVGRVSAVGADVDDVQPGDRVFLPVRFGAWADEAIAPARDLWNAPDEIPAEQLALIPINFSTAYLLLRSLVSLSSGDWVIQNAANSNVGYYLIRLARRWNVHTVNVVRRPELLPVLEAAGGDCNLVDGDDLAARVRARVPARRLKLAIDAIAGEATTRLGACFGGHGGLVASYGLLSGKACCIPPEMLMLDAVTLTGFFAARTLAQMDSAAVQAMHAEINRLICEDPPHARIAAVYPFENVRAAVAHAAAEGADREGKIVLVNR